MNYNIYTEMLSSNMFTYHCPGSVVFVIAVYCNKVQEQKTEHALIQGSRRYQLPQHCHESVVQHLRMIVVGVVHRPLQTLPIRSSGELHKVALNDFHRLVMSWVAHMDYCNAASSQTE